MKRMMPIQGSWIVFDDKDLLEMDSDDADGLMMLYKEYEQNKLSFFLAHGGGVDFINDRESDFCLLMAGNRRGKSYAGMAWLGVRILPTDPEWPCYTDHGLHYHEWGGPCKAIACSYTISNHLRPVIVPLLLEILPDDELKEYSPRYKGKGKKKVNFNGDMVLPLGCKSEIHLRAYQQDQVAFESDAYKYGLLDEQPQLARIDGLIERGRTGLEKTQYASMMTPHFVPGWPETGATGPLIRALKGQIDLGITIGDYYINTEDVPDEIFPAEEKEKAYQRWVSGPQKSGNMKDIREGQARYYGKPQSSQGLVVDEFDREIHVQPMDKDKQGRPFIKKDFTKYRGIDHGTSNPTACIWGAVDPNGFLYIYREYKQGGRTIPENCEEIVRLSGNNRVRVDSVEESGGMVRPIFEEEFTNEDYAASALDPRSFGTKSDGVNKNGILYNDWGLYCTPAKGKRDSYYVPLMRSWFRVDPELRNPFTGKMGSPRIFISPDCHHLITELESLVFKGNSADQNASEDPKKKDDHAYDGLKYLLGEEPTYMGDNYMDPYDEFQEQRDNRGSSFTGY